MDTDPGEVRSKYFAALGGLEAVKELVKNTGILNVLFMLDALVNAFLFHNWGWIADIIFLLLLSYIQMAIGVRLDTAIKSVGSIANSGENGGEA